MEGRRLIRQATLHEYGKNPHFAADPELEEDGSTVQNSETSPQWGMPMSGTPIGLPGPPHVPLGIPAGLQKHSIKNHTRVNIPEPTRKLRIDVQQSPGFSYPKPVNKVSIIERTFRGLGLFKQPMTDRREIIRPDCADGYSCPADMYRQ